MKVSIYSTFWNALKMKLDFKGALANWLVYADDVSIAVGTSEDGTYEAIKSYVDERGYPVSLIQTSFDFASDPFAYGKTENAAMQNCTGDLLVQQNGDERLGSIHFTKARLIELGETLYSLPSIDSYFVPTIDLYGSTSNYLSLSQKWYISKRGLRRGAVGFGIKADGRPDYNKTSSDELLRSDGSLATAYPLLTNPTIERLREYVAAGYPLSYHLGYCSFGDRIDRSRWWKAFWEMASQDPNQHPTTVEEIAAKQAKPHGLPLWPTI